MKGRGTTTDSLLKPSDMQGFSGELQGSCGTAFRTRGEALCKIESNEVLGASASGEVKA